MRPLIAGLVAVTLTIFCTSQLVLAQEAAAPASPAAQKALNARAKQKDAAAKGNRNAVAAEEKLKAEAVALAPTFVKSLSLPCTVTDARHETAYDNIVGLELSCQEGIGFVIVGAPDGSGGDSQDCIPNPRAPLPFACSLPGNANPSKGLQPYLVRAGSPCIVDKAVAVGQTDTLAIYEVACTSGVGELLRLTMPRTNESQVIVGSCLAFSTLVPGQNCSLTTPEANLAPVKAMVTKAGRPCDLKDQRYVGAANNGSEYFEYACNDGSGFMIQTTEKGEFQRTLSCVQAVNLGGCKLTDQTAALAKLTTDYTTAVKAAGFNCDVAKFANFPPKAGATGEALEIGCSNRPDSAVAVIKGDKAEVFNCVRAISEGYRCTYSQPEAAFGSLTENLKSVGRQTCVVNGARSMGASRTMAYVEVSCSDGNPGFVVTYPLGSSKPAEAVFCNLASGMGGGCTMPANTKAS